jgi:N-acetylmuramoyl-L-alanine amidase
MSLKLIPVFLFLFLSISFAQRLYKISVTVDGAGKELSYIINKDLDYISLREFADLVDAQKYFNSAAAKLEIKFGTSSIKVAGRNQFIVLLDKEGGEQKVIQIPVSTLLIGDDIYIPFIYVREYLSKASGKKITYDDRSKNMNLTSEKSALKPELAVKTKAELPDSIKLMRERKYDIYDILVDEKANGTLITLKTNKAIRIPRNSVNNGILYVFLSNTTVAPGLVSKIKSTGLVKSVKQNYVSWKNSQLEFLLKDGYSSTETFSDPETHDLIITIHNKLFSSPAATEGKSKWNFDCIVIDAGHGGKDPGTIGVVGTKEKDINLSIALKLGKLIGDNLAGVKVVYTRKTDEFIELYKRGKIANEAGGKLFISIHCNSTESKDNGYRGFEVYLLRPGKTKEAIRIAEFENSVIKYEENPNRYDKLTDENFILVSMAHSQYVRYSETFSDLLNQTWKNSLDVPSHGVKQAGFYVLVGASMPSVLIETGFLSNRKDEAFLTSANGQKSIAEAIFSSIKKYKEFYEKEISN